MANTKIYKVLFLVLAATLLIQDFAECSSRGTSVEFLRRKLILEMKEMAVKEGGRNNYGKKEDMPEDWELRRIPAGPDPLHHHGQGPNKPQTP